MSLHYFHCTDGVSLFADEQGSLVSNEQIFLAAMRRAEAVMQALPAHDWSNWFVCAYDDLRQMVEVFDFPHLRPPAALDGDGFPAGAIGLICAAGHGPAAGRGSSGAKIALKPRP